MCVTSGVACIVCVTLVVRLHESCRSLRLRNTHVHTPSGQSTPLSASAKHANVSFGFERLSPSHIPLTYVDVFAHTSVYGFEMVTDAIMTGSVVGKAVLVGMLVVVLGMLVVVFVAVGKAVLGMLLRIVVGMLLRIVVVGMLVVVGTSVVGKAVLLFAYSHPEIHSISQLGALQSAHLESAVVLQGTINVPAGHAMLEHRPQDVGPATKLSSAHEKLHRGPRKKCPSTAGQSLHRQFS